MSLRTSSGDAVVMMAGCTVTGPVSVMCVLPTVVTIIIRCQMSNVNVLILRHSVYVIDKVYR